MTLFTRLAWRHPLVQRRHHHRLLRLQLFHLRQHRPQPSCEVFLLFLLFSRVLFDVLQNRNLAWPIGYPFKNEGFGNYFEQ